MKVFLLFLSTYLTQGNNLKFYKVLLIKTNTAAVHCCLKKEGERMVGAGRREDGKGRKERGW